MNTLTTERLIIRPFTLDDLEAAHRLLDLDLEWAGPGITLEQRQEKLFFQIALAHWQVTNGIYGDRAILLKENQPLIGICGFRPWLCALANSAASTQAPAHNTLELGIGYALSSQHRGQGYATEAVKALIEYAFQELEIGRIVALTEKGNAASVKVMQRAGMQVSYNPNPDIAYPWAMGVIENNSFH